MKLEEKLRVSEKNVVRVPMSNTVTSNVDLFFFSVAISRKSKVRCLALFNITPINKNHPPPGLL